MIKNDSKTQIGTNENNYDEEVELDYSVTTKTRNLNSIISLKEQICEKCLTFNTAISQCEKSLNQIDEFISSLNSRANNYIYNLPLFNQSCLNLDFLHSQIFYSIDKQILPNSIKEHMKAIIKNLKVFSSKIEYISEKSTCINFLVEEYKNLKHSNIIEDTEEFNSNNINEIIKNFNSNKENIDSILKELKTTNENYSDFSNLSSTVNSMSHLRHNSSNITNNEYFEKPDKIIDSKTLNHLKAQNKILNKENTSLKIELKILLEGIKINNFPLITNDIMKDSYFIKLKDDNQLDAYVFDVKKYVMQLRKTNFFIA